MANRLLTRKEVDAKITEMATAFSEKHGIPVDTLLNQLRFDLMWAEAMQNTVTAPRPDTAQTNPEGSAPTAPPPVRPE